MESGPPSERDKVSHSTPKSDISSRPTSSCMGRRGNTSQSSRSEKMSDSTPKSAPSSRPKSRDRGREAKTSGSPKSDNVSHSSIKSTPSSRPNSSNKGRQGNTSDSTKSDYTNTLQGSSLSRPVSARKEGAPDLDETGESTRSLLSVLSHSSVGSLSTGTISSCNSANSSPDAVGQKTESKIGRHNQTQDIIKSPKDTHKDTNNDSPAPSPWEKWLIEKTKLERERIREQVRKDLEEIRVKKAEEERNKERRRHVEERVLEWLKEKERTEKKKLATERRRKRQEQVQRASLKQRNAEKDKVSREEWLSQKQAKEKKEKEIAQRAKQEKALAERLQKEKAEESFKKWKKESRNRPQPPKGSFYGKGHTGESSYPTPSFINPVPWRPIETSTPVSNVKPQTHGRTRNKKNIMEEVVESPPLLFRDRSKNGKNPKPCGRLR